MKQYSRFSGVVATLKPYRTSVHMINSYRVTAQRPNPTCECPVSKERDQPLGRFNCIALAKTAYDNKEVSTAPIVRMVQWPGSRLSNKKVSKRKVQSR